MGNSEIIFVLEESPEGGYQARALGESIFTEGNSLEELKENIKEAVLTHFEDNQHPRIVRLHYTKEELLAL
jgi:predicted RNase H-like HicB family nuclease